MATLEAALENLAGYPRWFVALCTIIVAVAAGWILAKVLKWTIYLAAVVAVGCVLAAVFAWWLA